MLRAFYYTLLRTLTSSYGLESSGLSNVHVLDIVLHNIAFFALRLSNSKYILFSAHNFDLILPVTYHVILPLINSPQYVHFYHLIISDSRLGNIRVWVSQ